MDFSIDESPAVKALGPLFKLTKVQLWDYGTTEVQELPHFQESIRFSNGDKDYERGDYANTDGFCSISEDLEVAKQMNDFGLPLSFRTNKETRYGMTSGKRKGRRKSNQQSPLEIDTYMLDSIKASDEESNLLTTSKMPDQSDILTNEIAEIDGLSNLSLERVDSLNSKVCTSTPSNEHESNGEVSNLGCDDSFGLDNNMSDGTECIPCTNEMMATGLRLDCDGLLLEAHLVMDHKTDKQSNDISLEVIKDSDISVFNEQAIINNYQIANSGEWIAYWDDFHMRTYFFNVETEESTWDPPSGMEHLVYGTIADEPAGLFELDNNLIDFMASEEVQASCDPQSPLDLANESRSDVWPLSQHTNTRNKKKKARRTKAKRILSVSSEGVLHEVTPSISKYWCQRYLLFSRFDSGIKMDEEGWFSVTPEPIAKHHAGRCGHGAIVDLFTGVGGNAIQFAQWSKHVIAIDVDPIKIDYARHNAAIYEVDDRIDFIKGDSFSLAPKLKANTVFMSPPWGGPAYSKVKKFDMNTMLKPRDGQILFNAGKGIAPKIVMFLPRNVDINQLAELSLSAKPPWSLEVEKNYLNGRLKAVTAYFSEPSMSS